MEEGVRVPDVEGVGVRVGDLVPVSVPVGVGEALAAMGESLG